MTAHFTEREVLEATGGRLARAGARPAFDGVSTDTRTVSPGALFVALKGDRFDAHDFLADAARAGAACAVVARGRVATPPAGLPLLAVDDTLAALGAIARTIHSKFSWPTEWRSASGAAFMKSIAYGTPSRTANSAVFRS